MAATRDAGFGDEVKRRIILGTYALSSGYYDAYYGQAQKVRTLISRDFAAAFEQADVLVSPTAPTTAFTLGEKLDDPIAMYLNDIATIPANLAGVPGMSLPSGLADEDGLPTGIQILAPATRDERLYGVGAALEAMLTDAGAARCSTGRPSSRPRRRSAHEHHHGRAGDGLRRGARGVRPGHGPRGPRRAQHRTKMFCGCADRVRRRAEQPGLPGVPRPARRPARGQRQGGRVGDPDRPGAQLRPSRRGAGSRGRTTSTRTCRRTSRPRQYDEPIAFDGLPRRRARGRRRPTGSRSSARTWRRTPASRCTSAAPPAGSTAPTTRWSTTTGPASR